MTSHQKNLVRFARALDFEDEVVRLTVTDKLILKVQLNCDRLSPFLHPSKHVSILSRYGSCRNLGKSFLVEHCSSMDRFNTLRCHRSNKHSQGTVFCSLTGPIYSVINVRIIVFPGWIEHNNLSSNLTSSTMESIPIRNYNNICTNFTTDRVSQTNDL